MSKLENYVFIVEGITIMSKFLRQKIIIFSKTMEQQNFYTLLTGM